MTEKQEAYNHLLELLSNRKNTKFESYNVFLKIKKYKSLTRNDLEQIFYEAKNRVRERNGTPAVTANYISTLEDKVVDLIEKNEDLSKGTLNSVVEGQIDFSSKSIDDLYKFHKIDSRLYVIKNYWSKVKSSGKFTSSVFAVKKDIAQSPTLQAEVFKELLSNHVPNLTTLNNYKIVKKESKNNKEKYLYELSLPDLHIGKLACEDESGEDYDIKIASERYKLAIEELLTRINTDNLEKILLPIGNDMIQVDNTKGQTTAGTQVDTDSRFHKIVNACKNLLIDTINQLSTLCPVDVIVVPGNHDTESMAFIGMILDAYYTKSKNINIINVAKPRKYYQYGDNSFMFVHGNREKHNQLGLIFASENPKLWADTKYRFVKIGHYHHNKKIDVINNQEFQGYQFQILPSLSASDAWHNQNGYMSLKQAKSFLYSKNQGCIGEFTYTV